MSRLGRILFDACTLENFATVERLDLLRARYSGRCAWTAGVEREIRRGAVERPRLRLLDGAVWLGTPIDSDDPGAVQEIDRIRRALGAVPQAGTRHLGEAQIIYHVHRAEASATVATDDRAAYDMAVRRGLRVIDTPDILRDCYEAHLLSCPEAFELLVTMAAAGRGVAVPDSHWHICPAVP